MALVVNPGHRNVQLPKGLSDRAVVSDDQDVQVLRVDHLPRHSVNVLEGYPRQVVSEGGEILVG